MQDLQQIQNNLKKFFHKMHCIYLQIPYNKKILKKNCIVLFKKFKIIYFFAKNIFVFKLFYYMSQPDENSLYDFF